MKRYTSRFAIWAFLLWAVVATTSIAAFAQNGAIQGTTTSSTGQPRAGVNVSICYNLATTGASVTSNVATYTFASNPQTLGFVNGFTLTVF